MLFLISSRFIINSTPQKICIKFYVLLKFFFEIHFLNTISWKKYLQMLPIDGRACSYFVINLSKNSFESIVSTSSINEECLTKHNLEMHSLPTLYILNSILKKTELSFFLLPFSEISVRAADVTTSRQFPQHIAALLYYLVLTLYIYRM